MTDRLITADASRVSRADFFQVVTGRPLRTKEQKLAQWQADIERYADMIERGSEYAVPPPCIHDARLLVAGRKRARAA
jgi:hypothetical protein